MSRLEKTANRIKSLTESSDKASLYKQNRFLTSFEKELIRVAFMDGTYFQQALDIEQERLEAKGK
jgi:hypothetical protein